MKIVEDPKILSAFEKEEKKEIDLKPGKLVEDENIITQFNKLENEEGITIVGEAYNGEEVIPLLESNAVDVAVLDISMPKMDGIDLTKFIKRLLYM